MGVVATGLAATRAWGWELVLGSALVKEWATVLDAEALAGTWVQAMVLELGGQSGAATESELAKQWVLGGQLGEGNSLALVGVVGMDSGNWLVCYPQEIRQR